MIDFFERSVHDIKDCESELLLVGMIMWESKAQMLNWCEPKLCVQGRNAGLQDKTKMLCGFFTS